jgi:hypothetical protein
MTLREEPYVEIPTAAGLEGWSKEDEIIYNQQLRQSEKYRLYANAFDYMNESGIRGSYLEFGCHRARTFRMALTEARRHQMEDMQFWAFDSFRGLPAVTERTRSDHWVEGALSTSEEEFRRLIDGHGIYLERVHLVTGFYEQTLSRYAVGGRAAMICVDCDLYKSAQPVFRFIEPLLQEGTVLYIDDWFGSPAGGVQAAFHQHALGSHWKYTPHMTAGWAGQSFLVWR